MKKKKNTIKNLASQSEIGPHGIVKLLLADHKLLRSLMKEIKSQKATPAKIKKAYKELKSAVISHVKAEERTFLALIINHPAFKDNALESYEEQRVHDYIFAGIDKVKESESKVERMKIYCEILKHHLDEEEEDLFPRFKKVFAKKTRKKAAVNYSKVRKKTDTSNKKRGAVRFKTIKD